MSPPVEAHKTKKRKHAAAVDGAGGAESSTKRSRKDKDGPDGAKRREKTKVDKGKGRATDDAFRIVRASLTVSVPPTFAADLRGGVEELLDSMLMRYVCRLCAFVSSELIGWSAPRSGIADIFPHCRVSSWRMTA